MRLSIVAALAAALAGCSATDQIVFEPGVGQQAIVRDGVAAIQSNGPHSVIMARPVARELNPHDRAVFVLALANIGNMPLDFRVSDITVQRTENGQAVETLDVITYEELVADERRAQTVSAIFGALGAVGNSMSAANAGYSTANTTIYGPYGTYSAHTTVYNPVVASMAQSQANYENAALMNSLAEEGQANLAVLEQSVIKDNTLLPGEWYGGQLHIQPSRVVPVEGAPRTYRAIVRVGPDSHVFDVVQARIPR